MKSVSTNSEVLFHVLEDFVDVSVGVNLSDEILKNRWKVELGPKLKRLFGAVFFLILWTCTTFDYFLLGDGRSSNFIMAVSIYFTPPYARGEKKIWMPRESNPDEQALQANTTIHNGLSCTIVAVMLSQTGWDPRCIFYHLTKPKEKLRERDILNK